MPTLLEVRNWLKTQPGSLSDADLQVMLDGEAANQARACVIPAEGVDTEPDLLLALFMRVARAAARKGVPLGVLTGFGDGGMGAVRAGSWDPDITRLEFPHRKLAVG